MPSVIKHIERQLKNHQDATNAAGMEKYFKGVLRFHGIKSPELKKIFGEIYKKHIIQKEVSRQINLAYQLIKSCYGEEKKFGVMLLQKNLKHLNTQHISEITEVIENYVYDWATCDGLAGSLIGKMIKSDPSIGKSIYPWKNSSNLWLQRSSCVAFVLSARFGNHNEQIIKTCRVCVKNSERFVQLGVGWVLRELSLADLDLVVNFIKANYTYFSREGLRYAIEKMKPQLRQKLLNYDFKS